MTIEPAAPLMTGILSHKLQAYTLALAAGAVSSLGPCALPRCIAAAGMAARTLRASAARFGLLQAGLTCGYCIMGLGSSLLAALVRHSAVFYLLLAALLVASGLQALLIERSKCGHEGRSRIPHGGTFLIGASFAFVVSPCCTPFVLAVGVMSDSPFYAATLMAAFAVGHGCTMLAAMAGMQPLKNRFTTGPLLRAAASVSGTLLLALGAYYAVLA